MIEDALEVATDPDYRFDLAMQLGKLEVAKVSSYVKEILLANFSYLGCLVFSFFPFNEFVLLVHIVSYESSLFAGYCDRSAE